MQSIHSFIRASSSLSEHIYCIHWKLMTKKLPCKSGFSYEFNTFCSKSSCKIGFSYKFHTFCYKTFCKKALLTNSKHFVLNFFCEADLINSIHIVLNVCCKWVLRINSIHLFVRVFLTNSKHFILPVRKTENITSTCLHLFYFYIIIFIFPPVIKNVGLIADDDAIIRALRDSSSTT